MKAAPGPVSREELLARVRAVVPEAVEFRRALHRIPETGFEERLTAQRIREALLVAGVQAEAPRIGTDVCGVLASGRPGRCVLLRADIDALPLEEAEGRPWRSTRPGAAHACGHDGHASMLLGALRVLHGLRDRLAGSVRFVFQPAEETLGGGLRLIAAGLLDAEPKPEAAFALHGWPGLPLGVVAAEPGAVLAAADSFRLTIRGKGGHGAMPHLGADPIVAAAQTVLALQTVVSRSVNPFAPAVVSVCSMHGGAASNVIPDEAVLTGTTRFFDRSLRDAMRGRMRDIVAGTAVAAGCAAELVFDEGSIPLVNDAAMVALAARAVESSLGPGRFHPGHQRTMGGEDFAFYLDRVPGAFLSLGLGEDWPRLHSAAFDFNDEAIETGILALCAVALEFLAGGA